MEKKKQPTNPGSGRQQQPAAPKSSPARGSGRQASPPQTVTAASPKVASSKFNRQIISGLETFRMTFGLASEYSYDQLMEAYDAMTEEGIYPADWEKRYKERQAKEGLEQQMKEAKEKEEGTKNEIENEKEREREKEKEREREEQERQRAIEIEQARKKREAEEEEEEKKKQQERERRRLKEQEEEREREKQREREREKEKEKERERERDKASLRVQENGKDDGGDVKHTGGDVASPATAPDAGSPGGAAVGKKGDPDGAPKSGREPASVEPAAGRDSASAGGEQRGGPSPRSGKDEDQKSQPALEAVKVSEGVKASGVVEEGQSVDESGDRADEPKATTQQPAAQPVQHPAQPTQQPSQPAVEQKGEGEWTAGRRRPSFGPPVKSDQVTDQRRGSRDDDDDLMSDDGVGGDEIERFLGLSSARDARAATDGAHSHSNYSDDESDDTSSSGGGLRRAITSDALSRKSSLPASFASSGGSPASVRARGSGVAGYGSGFKQSGKSAQARTAPMINPPYGMSADKIGMPPPPISIFADAYMLDKFRGNVHILKEGDNTIGRSSKNQICVMSLSLSRKHCCLHKASGEVTALDLGSTHGSLVNLKNATEKTVLQRGDVLMCATTVLAFGWNIPLMEGKLSKRGGGVIRKYKAYYFVLKERHASSPTLNYYKTGKERTPPKGSIEIASVLGLEEGAGAKFQVKTKSGNVDLQADTPEEKAKWMSILSKTIKNIKLFSESGGVATRRNNMTRSTSVTSKKGGVSKSSGGGSLGLGL